MSTRLYSDVVSGGSGSELENFEPQKRSRSGGLVSWLTEYQTENEEVALNKALEISKVILFPKRHMPYAIHVS